METITVADGKSGVIYSSLSLLQRAGTAQSVQRLALGWTARRSNPGGG